MSFLQKVIEGFKSKKIIVKYNNDTSNGITVVDTNEIKIENREAVYYDHTRNVLDLPSATLYDSEEADKSLIN